MGTQSMMAFSGQKAKEAPGERKDICWIHLKF